MVASVSSLRIIGIGFHFADLSGMPGPVRGRCQQPLVAVPRAKERVGHSMFAKPVGEQQSIALFATLDELLQGLRAAPAASRVQLRGSLTFSGSLGNVVQDKFIHLASV